MSNDSEHDPPHAGPLSDTPLGLPSGTVVRVRNLVIFKNLGGPGSLTIYIETPTAAHDADRLAREAQELATMHDMFAQTQNITTISVAVCRTPECIELRGAPSERFSFTRANDGAWGPAVN
jgi:hypothetical protein